MSQKSIYITTTIPYVNADPHVGFALEIVQADTFARLHSLLGYDVFFNTGTDEHGIKIYQAALDQGLTAKAFADRFAERFRELKTLLTLHPDIFFIRTTDTYHEQAAMEFWRKCKGNGWIYKKNYKIRYCVGCELEKTDSELDAQGRCPIHPNKEIETIDEENYFFKLSAFRDQLSALYKNQPDFVVPDFRFNEIKVFIERGLEDFSISRIKSKMPWGVAVPDDPDHVMYVWFDAFINYISAIGWPLDQDKFQKYWPVIQFAGKDQVRQQAAMWQAMLMSIGLPPSKQIVIHGFITSGGQKMSKSLGNVINPYDIVAEYGTDALRYFLLREIHPFEDSDFTLDRFKEAYNAHLVNGLGNLASRILQMAINYGVATQQLDHGSRSESFEHHPDYAKSIKEYQYNNAMNYIWDLIASADQYIQKEEPFKKAKINMEAAKADLVELLRRLNTIAFLLQPVLPGTAEKLTQAIKEGSKPTLFPRK